MSSTPLWVPVLVAALGVLGTLGGVVITQRRADKREREQWEREARRQREAWVREDRARTFDQRREAYLSFYESLRALSLLAYNHGMGLPPARPEDDQLPWNWQFPTYQRLQRLELYAPTDTYEAAVEAYSAAYRWGFNTLFGQDNEVFYDFQDLADRARREFLRLTRRDLHIGDSTVPPEVDASEGTV